MSNITEAEFLMYMDVMDPVRSKNTEYSKKMEKYKDQYKIWTIDKGVEKILENYKNENIEVPSEFNNIDKVNSTVGPNTRVNADGEVSWFIGDTEAKDNNKGRVPYDKGDSWMITNIWVVGQSGTEDVLDGEELEYTNADDLKNVTETVKETTTHYLVRPLTSDENGRLEYVEKKWVIKNPDMVSDSGLTVYTDSDGYHYVVIKSNNTHPYVLRPLWTLKRQDGSIIRTTVFFDDEITNTLNMISNSNITKINKGNIVNFIRENALDVDIPKYSDSIQSFIVDPIFGYDSYATER